MWYRAWTQKAALELGLSGWVRNRLDGTVEAVFSGTPEQVETMIAKCRKGPPLAKVKDIQRTDTNPPGESGFELLETR